MVDIRQLQDRLISTVGFPVLITWYLYTESAPWSSWALYRVTHMLRCFPIMMVVGYLQKSNENWSQDKLPDVFIAGYNISTSVTHMLRCFPIMMVVGYLQKSNENWSQDKLPDVFIAGYNISTKHTSDGAKTNCIIAFPRCKTHYSILNTFFSSRWTSKCTVIEYLMNTSASPPTNKGTRCKMPC